MYFGSDDIEADIAKTQGLGGTAGEKQPIPGMGWFAHCSDTEATPSAYSRARVGADARR